MIADSFLNGRNRRKYARNTYFERISENVIGVKLHRTFIVTISKDGPMVLNTGGWETKTTRDRINSVLAMIFKAHKPYVATRNNFMYFQPAQGSPVEYFDGMQVGTLSGLCVNYWNR
jgi:hypothetical protein